MVTLSTDPGAQLFGQMCGAELFYDLYQACGSGPVLLFANGIIIEPYQYY